MKEWHRVARAMFLQQLSLRLGQISFGHFCSTFGFTSRPNEPREFLASGTCTSYLRLGEALCREQRCVSPFVISKDTSY
jgi:hypothetical protein